jgi:hypothetical protein
MTAALTRTSAALARRRPLTIALPLLVASMLSAMARAVSRSMTCITESGLTRRVSLRLSRVPIPARLVSVALPVEPAAALTDREVGRLPLGRLALGSGKGGANQRTMHRPLILGAFDNGLFDVDGFGRFGGFDRFGRRNRFVFDHVFDCFFGSNQNRRFSRVDGRRRQRRDRLLPSRCGDLGVFVLVLGVTRGAACLLHLV